MESKDWGGPLKPLKCPVLPPSCHIQVYCLPSSYHGWNDPIYILYLSGDFPYMTWSSLRPWPCLPGPAWPRTQLTTRRIAVSKEMELEVGLVTFWPAPRGPLGPAPGPPTHAGPVDSLRGRRPQSLWGDSSGSRWSSLGSEQSVVITKECCPWGWATSSPPQDLQLKPEMFVG